jgi:4-oxalomesaconate tautomerase
MSGIPCLLIRGGTSKGAYFEAKDLPADAAERDDLLLRIMGSPDPRQIDGIGGGHPLTSKVAVISPSKDPNADVDYLFLQVSVDKAQVSDSQNCGNLLAGVGPFAVERGLVRADLERSRVRIRMVNSDSVATATFRTPGGEVQYAGDVAIDGVPGTAAPISLAFADTAGSTCGALLPTGQVVDTVDGVQVTCIDNGMPVVILDAADLGITGYESPETLEANNDFTDRLEHIRLQAGKLMGLGDVSKKTVPKMTLVSAPSGDGAVNTRTFIPFRCHTSIGVLGAVTVGTAARINGSVAQRLSRTTDNNVVRIEHPTGFFDVEIDVRQDDSGEVQVDYAAALRTARKLFDGRVFPHAPYTA